MNKQKGKKFYGVITPKCSPDFINWCSGDIKKAKMGLNQDGCLLVEMTVTRVFTREKDLKEIEIEI